MLETIYEMAIAVARLEERLLEGETLVEMLEIELVRIPPPPLVFSAPNVPVAPPTVCDAATWDAQSSLDAWRFSQ